MSKLILIVDDEQDIREILAYNLLKEGYRVEVAKDGVEGLEKAKAILPDLIILDVMMPRMDGIETCEQLRKIKLLDKTIICFLTARSEDYSQIAGLESGADDYVSKPIKPKVFISRINALLRRSLLHNTFNGESSVIIDRDRYVVFHKQNELQLPRKEFELLALLSSKPGMVFERNQILEKVWGQDIVVGDRTIDVHIRKLREKLGSDCIKTVKGIGYKYEPENIQSGIK
jgi:two-component system alkaline phosphatase synthesis response regulator PhoP